MRAGHLTYASGLRSFVSSKEDAALAVAEAAAAFGTPTPGFLVLYASSDKDPQALADALAAHFPGVPHAGCSTAGEIGPSGYTENTIVFIAFPQASFCVTSGVIGEHSNQTVAEISKSVETLKREHDARASVLPKSSQTFALSIIDGLSLREETLVSAIHRGLEGIDVVGGSAGDNLAFANTWIIHNGQLYTKAAVLVLVRTHFRFKVFHHDNFEPTALKLVVTDCDAETRTVRELNGEIAAREYASCMNIDEAHLVHLSFASHPLVVKVGGEYFCRSIRNTNEDGSLTFFCAVENGVVLTVAEPQDLVASATQALQALDDDLNGIDMVLGFDCVFRRLEAENRQQRHRMSDLLKSYNVIGFSTYGEQFAAMHLNQTFTGVAISAQTFD